ncbi:hypothetical protein MalM25_20040 [Planctomycetes bacterium MalM25]|nr:hypothetical protein MalM25_20040 [Planctomycetes bacterium MalM25]
MMLRTLHLVAPLLPLVVLGCGKGGIERHDLHGAVTYRGEPIPAGVISFRPDRSRGGTGPSGFGTILDGEYSTGVSGRGAVAGPVEVMIEGATSKKPMSPALFPIYKTTIDVDGDTLEFDFEVPEQTMKRKR